MRDLGESMPEGKSSFFRPYGYDYMIDKCYLMFGESYLGKRVFDVLSVIELLKSKGCRSTNLYGNRQGAILALFVCVFSDLVKSVYFEKLPESFSKLFRAISTDLTSVNLLKGILKIADIPEILEFLKKRGIELKLIQ